MVPSALGTSSPTVGQTGRFRRRDRRDWPLNSDGLHPSSF